MRITSVSNGNSNTNFTSYDAKGNETASSQVSDSRTYNFSYTYNLTSALMSETYSDGRELTTSYDAANCVYTSAAFAQPNTKFCR